MRCRRTSLKRKHALSSFPIVLQKRQMKFGMYCHLRNSKACSKRRTAPPHYKTHSKPNSRNVRDSHAEEAGGKAKSVGSVLTGQALSVPVSRTEGQSQRPKKP